MPWHKSPHPGGGCWTAKWSRMGVARRDRVEYCEIERTALTKNEAGLYYMPLGNVTRV